MLEWLTGRRRLAARPRRVEPSMNPAKVKAAGVCGKSAPLYKYLDERFADAVVLTFQEIEDLLGFPLPALARVSGDWWTAPDSDANQWSFADSWILAERTARPNMLAQTVAFERVP